VIIWLVLLLQFRQRRLAQEEQLEGEQYERLKAEGKDTSVFEGKTTEESMHLAVRRLAWLERFLIPIFAIIYAVYMLAIGYWLFYRVNRAEVNPLAADKTLQISAAYLAGLAVLSFLFSRYAVGMSRQSAWRPLRAGGSYLLSNVLGCVVLAGMIIGIQLFDPAKNGGIWDKWVAYALSILMMVIGAETVMNLVLDVYRPRIKGRYRRASFESRLLGLLSEPEGIFKTAAHALDYQFGFKVSDTWFFKLLQRAIVPLVVVMAAILYLMTCLAIVPAGNKAVLERFGNPLNIETPLEPGLHLKLPWPVDAVRVFPTEQLQSISIGFEHSASAERKPVIWTAQHWENEYPFLVALKSEGRMADAKDAEIQEESAARKRIFDMLVVALVVQYHIDNIQDYGYGTERCYQSPDEFLKAMCYQETMRFAASSDLQSLMGPGWQETTRLLQKRFQQRADDYKLGIQIAFVGLESVHPPWEQGVGESFEQVVAALQTKQAKVLTAHGESNAILSEARGDSGVRLSKAQAYKVRREKVAEAVSGRFEKQALAYKEGKEVYLWREYLSVLDEFTPELRKYVVDSADVDSWVYLFDLKEQLQPDLLSGLDIGPTEAEQ